MLETWVDRIINVDVPNLKTGEKGEAFTIYQGRGGGFVREGYGEGGQNSDGIFEWEWE